MTAPKTNAVRLLERQGIPFELRPYEVDPDDLSAEAVARKVGLPPEQVFKTLVAHGNKHGVCLAVGPGDCELELKALVKATGDKKIGTVPLKEVEPLTGEIRGGVTALACRKNFPVYLDETAQMFDVISISAGMRGLQVLLSLDNYIRVVRAEVTSIAKTKGYPESCGWSPSPPCGLLLMDGGKDQPLREGPTWSVKPAAIAGVRGCQVPSSPLTRSVRTGQQK